MTAVPETWLPMSQYAMLMEDWMLALGYPASPRPLIGLARATRTEKMANNTPLQPRAQVAWLTLGATLAPASAAIFSQMETVAYQISMTVGLSTNAPVIAVHMRVHLMVFRLYCCAILSCCCAHTYI